MRKATPRRKRAKVKAPARKTRTRKAADTELLVEEIGICLSINQAADEFGHDRRTITKAPVIVNGPTPND
jgi:hypothetical protein